MRWRGVHDQVAKRGWRVAERPLGNTVRPVLALDKAGPQGCKSKNDQKKQVGGETTDKKYS